MLIFISSKHQCFQILQDIISDFNTVAAVAFAAAAALAFAAFAAAAVVVDAAVAAAAA